MSFKNYISIALVCISVLLLSALLTGDEFPFWVYTDYRHNPGISSMYAQIKDCGFNRVNDTFTQETIQAANATGLKVYANNPSGEPYRYSMSHYMVWQAEEDMQCTDCRGMKHDNGSESIDGKTWQSVDVDTAYSNNDTTGYLVKGPGAAVEIQNWLSVTPIRYTAVFNMKIDAIGDSARVATIGVWRGSTLILSRDVYSFEFTNSPADFDTFQISDFPFNMGGSPKVTVTPEGTLELTDPNVEFRVKWWYNRKLTVDWIKVCDENGKLLIDEQIYDNDIKAYHDTSNCDNLAYWYLRDEPPVADCFRPYRYIDSLLGSVQDPKRAITSFIEQDGSLNEFLDLGKPAVLLTDRYPIDDTTGTDGASLQTALDKIADQLGFFMQTVPDTIEMQFVVQAHSYDDGIGTPLRDPTPWEMRCMTNLALACGAEGIAYYDYTSDTRGGEIPIVHGLVEMNGDLTDKWHEIHDHIAPRIDSIGPILRGLTWDRAYLFDPSVVNGDYIRDIGSSVFPSDEYIEVGVFKDTTANEDYFMLVNRRCLETEAETLEVTTNKGGVCLIEDMYTGADNTHDAAYTSDESGIFTAVTFLPGEGRLFKLVLVPAIELSAAAYDFGDVPVGTSADCDLTVFNRGTANLLVGSVTSDMNDFSIISPSFPQTIAAGESINATVRFGPCVCGTKGGSITFASDDPSNPTKSVALTGTGIALIPPGNLTANSGCYQITLTWQDSSDGTSGFRIERKTGINGTYSQIDSVEAGVSCYTDNGLSGLYTYYYQVRASHGCGSSVYCTEMCATPLSIPNSPTSLSATAACDSIVLSWQDHSGNENGFYIYRKAGSGDFAPLDTASSNDATYTDDDVSPGTLYSYLVRAANTCGFSGYSDTITTGNVPVQVVFQPGVEGRDSYVRRGSYANINYGDEVYIEAKNNNSYNYDRRIYIEFNIAPIETATITQAILYLYIDDPQTAWIIGCYATTSYWSENSITWANQPGLGALLSTTQNPSSSGWQSWNVTSYAQGPTYGILDFAIWPTAIGNYNFNYYSSDYSVASLRPKLQITYDECGGSAPPPANNPPSITIVNPPSGGATVDASYTITWTGSDPDGDVCTVDLCRDSNTSPGGETLIVSNTANDGNYTWNTSSVTEGSYYIYGTINDGHGGTGTDYSSGRVTVDHPSCTLPSITSLNPTSGAVGNQVIITGSYFTTTPGSVTFYSSKTASVTSWADTQIVCNVPTWALSGNVTVTTSCGTSNGIYFTVTVSGCPYVSPWTEGGYAEGNNILAASEDTSRSELDVTDYFRLEQPCVERDGKYWLKLREFEHEHTWLDQTRLLAVDHPNGLQLGVADSGEVFLYKREIEPVSCVDSAGVSRLGLINSAGAGNYEGFPDEWLTIDFGHVGNVENMYVEIVADLQPDPPKEQTIVVQLQGEQEWEVQDIALLHPRQHWATHLVDLSPYLDNGPQDIVIRLYWLARHKVDHICLAQSVPGPFVETECVLASAVHSEVGSVTDSLSMTDENYAELSPGEHIELSFVPTEQEGGYARDFVFVATGHYVTEGAGAKAVVQMQNLLPTEFSLKQNYPNPFNPETEIEFGLPEAASVKLAVYNILGQVVEVLVDSDMQAGYHRVNWDRQGASSGVYFYQIEANDYVATRRMVLMK